MHCIRILAAFVCLWITGHCLTDRGSIQLTGAPTGWTPHIAGGNCGVSISGGTALTLQQNCAPRVYMMRDSTNLGRFPNLMQKTIKFTVNISKATCGCNAALYLIQVPSTATGDYYCDAQCPNGQCCTEIDIFEANTRAFQATLHCAAGDNPCKWGCGVNWKSGNGYGVGGSKINTANDFNCEMSFVQNSNGILSAIKVKLSQGTSTLSYSITDSGCSIRSGYVSGLTNAVKSGQLVMAISYWGGDMNWLDGCSAGGSCPASSAVTFKNFKLINGVTAIEDDDASTNSGQFVGSPGFYALIGICVLIALIAVVAAVVIVKKRKNVESV